MARGKDRNPFGPGTLRFLRALQRNNDRVWFQAHKDDYEAEVREPALMFIRIMARHVQRISPRLTAIDKRVGGSLMRIHRDVRFSKSKLPYKTNVGIQFRHEAGKDIHAPGLYFHVEPGRVFLGCGMWRPDPESLHAVRDAIVDDPKNWKRVRDAKRFRESWELGGASLKRAPRGCPADHPMIEDLKRTDHIAFTEFPDRVVVDPDLIEKVAGLYRGAAGYLRWQAQALDLPF
jgi:uncharacterized protein (TIGR02453 family)